MRKLPVGNTTPDFLIPVEVVNGSGLPCPTFKGAAIHLAHLGFVGRADNPSLTPVPGVGHCSASKPTPRLAQYDAAPTAPSCLLCAAGSPPHQWCLPLGSPWPRFSIPLSLPLRSSWLPLSDQSGSPSPSTRYPSSAYR